MRKRKHAFCCYIVIIQMYMHMEESAGARSLALCLKLPVLYVRKGSGETLVLHLGNKFAWVEIN